MKLTTPGLYILSGPSGSGKSTWIRNNNLQEFTFSTDELRKTIAGTLTWIEDSGKESTHPSSRMDELVFDLLERSLAGRLKEGLLTFVDSTALDDASRKKWVKLAVAHQVPACILIFDAELDECLEGNRNRKASIPETGLRQQWETFQKTSRYPFTLIKREDRVREFTLPELPHERFDVFGDIHGLRDSLFRFLRKLGYCPETGEHPDNRKLLVLGDLVDRGPDSLELLEWAQALQSSGHVFIKGNHEAKLLYRWQAIQKGRALHGGSYAGLTTLEAFLRSPLDWQEKTIDFLSRLPAYTTYQDLVFCHADIVQFDPLRTLRSDMIYGNRLPKEAPRADELYARNYAAGLNTRRLVHGHIPNAEKADTSIVLSLEEKQVYSGGHLLAAHLEDLLPQEDLRKAVIREPGNFDFDKVKKEGSRLKAQLDELVKRKLVVRASDDETGMTLYKYHRRVLFDRLWSEDPLLVKARGLVLDRAGQIVQHAFDRCFNHGENGCLVGADPELPVVAVDKLNGFMAAVTQHPYKPGELLVTTNGSLDQSSPYGLLARQYLASRHSAIVGWLSSHPVTLMFEVLDPSDPHIVQYTEHHYGAWLLGVRGHGQADQPWPESEVDKVAESLGLRRPSWKVTTLGALLQESKTESNVEGWMIRAADTEAYLGKLKTVWYLNVKFLSRMNNEQWVKLFAAPWAFKQRVDEEFYPLVDHLVSSSSLEEIQAIPNTERSARLHELLLQLAA